MNALVTDAFFAQARARPAAPAVGLKGRRWSYGELAAGVTATAQQLAERLDGDVVGGRVAVSLPPGVRFLQRFLGVAAAGAQAVVCDPRWSSGELAEALAEARPAVLFTDDPATAGESARDLAVLTDDAPVAGADVAACCAPPVAGAEVVGLGAPPAPPIDATAGFYVGFTSGTTGRPRGFVRSHRSWVRSVEVCDEAFGSVRGEHVLAPGSPAHSLFLFAVVHALSSGACLHLLPRFGAHAALRLLQEEPITRLWAVPAMVAGMTRAAEGAGPATTVPAVRSVLSSGDSWPPELARRVRALFPNAALVDFYGASELSFVSACYEPDRVPATCVGRPLPGVEAKVCHEDETEAPTGEPGRLWVRSPLVFSGYLHEAPPGEWVTVGDVARWDEQGRLHRLGRADELVTTGGRTVAPQEVEQQLCRLPEVAEVAVVGLSHAERGQVLAAVIRWREGASLAPAALRRHCRATLAAGKRPRRFFSTRALPATPNGKVARSRLREALEAGTADVVELT